MKNINKIIILSAISSTFVLGNPNVDIPKNLPNSSTIDRQLERPRDLPTQPKEIIDIEGNNIELLKDDGSNKTILVKSFTIEGNTRITTGDILEAIKEFENKELTFRQLQEVTRVITKLYRKAGYFVARAYLPQQNIQMNNNVLQIKIIEGSYGKFIIDNKSLVRDGSIQDIFDLSKSGETINYADVRKSILLVNNRAGVSVAKAEIGAGEEFGSSNFYIETIAEPRVDGYGLIDNHGSRYTGEYRTQGLVNINSLATLGDKLSLTGVVSNGANLKNGRLAYEIPLTASGLTMDLAYNRTEYKLIKEFKDLDAYGNSDVLELGFKYPLILESEQALFAKVKYYYKNFNDYILDEQYEDKYINSVVASLDYEKNYSLGKFPASLLSTINFTSGNLKSTAAKQDGKYNKIEAYISHDLMFNQIFSLNTSITAQKVFSNKNLDGSEQLSLGGAYGVKVYPYSEQSGENGYILSNEFFTELPNIARYKHKIGVFYDIADVYRENTKLDSTFERERLADVGVGYYSQYDDFFARVQMAWTANSKPIESEKTDHQNYKILFQAGMVF